MRSFITAAAIVLLVLCSACESDSDNIFKPKYHPTDGRNLSPDLPKQFQQDPQWPNDVNRGGGGGNAR
jgi:hypothetical protein